VGFTKLHSSLTASSLWNEADNVRIIFVTMLSMSDSEGNVKASVVGLAHQARKSLSETQSALAILSAPDPNSGRKELDGRRITEIEGGWHLVTHEFYRELGMSEETKRYWRERKRQQRQRQLKTVKECPGQSEKSVSVSASSSVSVQGEEEIEKKGRPKDREAVIFYIREIGLPEADGHYYWDKWQAGGYVNGGKPIKDWKALIRSHKAAGYCPSQKRNIRPSSFQKPDYRKSPPRIDSSQHREPTTEEYAKASSVARAEVEKLKQQLKH
jgi:hypothetical protein